MTEANASENVEVRELSGSARTDGTGERRRKGSVSRLISMSNEESDDSIQNTIYENTFPMRA